MFSSLLELLHAYRRTDRTHGEANNYIFTILSFFCVIVIRVPGYRSRGPGFDSRRYQIFWEVLGLERGPLTLMSRIAELLGRNNSGFGLENRECGRGDPLRWPRDTFYQQKLALTSPTSGGRSVDIRLRTKATELSVCLRFFRGREWDSIHFVRRPLIGSPTNSGL
jgi:hypothetical protein